jgi:mannose-6-phosphate isomerase-like protein (cupin superfamily)
MAAIEACRTATLGGHVERCDDCGMVRIAYNSCRDRHCPKCQGLARPEWLADRQADLLPVPYFHVVFTASGHGEQVCQPSAPRRPGLAVAITIPGTRSLYQSADSGSRYQVKRVCVNPGARLSLQKHFHRSEHWVVVRGAKTHTRNKCGSDGLTPLRSEVWETLRWREGDTWQGAWCQKLWLRFGDKVELIAGCPTFIGHKSHAVSCQPMS